MVETNDRLEVQPKPPLGTAPFHIMEIGRDFCGLCGIARIKIVDEAKDFCPAIEAANNAAYQAWEIVINRAFIRETTARTW